MATKAATTEKFEKAPALTLDRLRAVISYQPETGEFVWLKTLASKAPKGKVAGCIGHYGYRVIKIDGRDYRAARLAFLYMTGGWPEGVADHVNGIRDDDRWANLRPATLSENAANAKRRSDQPHLKGVHFNRHAKRWSASIQVRGRAKHLGLFDTAMDAAAAYSSAARAAFGDFARNA